MEIIDRWEKGACVGLDVNTSDAIFFPKPGRPRKEPPYVQYCGFCPIVNFCLSYALIYDEEGIWGNTTKNQRDLLLQKSPHLRDALIQEARFQGWYVARKTVDELTHYQDHQTDDLPIPEEDTWFDIEPPETLLFLFDFETELPLQTPLIESIPPALSPMEPEPSNSPNDLSVGPTLFRFEFELL